MRLKYLRRYRVGAIGAGVVLVGVLAALLAPLVSPYNPYHQNIIERLRPPGTLGPAHIPHYLGTDQLGRDVLSRVLYGGRVSFGISATAMVLAMLVGTVLGLCAGFYGGRTDDAIMRLVDLQMAFPFILLALALLGALGPSLRNVIVVFIVTGWPVYTRTIRASVLTLRSTSLVEAARAIGLRDFVILLRYILLNSLGPLFVLGSFEMGRIILMEASLSFLGLGVQPPTASWGGMVADGRDYITRAWWLITFPGVAIMFSVLGVNLIGDAAREYLDPRERVR